MKTYVKPEIDFELFEDTDCIIMSTWSSGSEDGVDDPFNDDGGIV